jgi:hypothetical protein
LKIKAAAAAVYIYSLCAIETAWYYCSISISLWTVVSFAPAQTINDLNLRVAELTGR